MVWATVLIQGTLPPARAGERDGPALESLPAGVDLRPKFAAWNLPWRSQGGRGTCSVFALVGGLEYAVARSRGEGRVLSVEFLNWASNRAIRHDADGGFFSDLWKGFERYGVCGEADLPYRAAFDAGLEPPAEIRGQARGWVNQGWGLHWIKRWDVTTGVTGDQFLAIKRTLASEWPVAGGLRWPKEERWEGHVLQMAPPEGVFDGHSVLLVGYRNDPRQPGGGVFLIRNSNRDDPEGALSYEYVRAYLNDAVWVEPPAPGVGGPPR